MDKNANLWAMAIHLSVFAGYAIPFAGLIAPILIWQLKKEEFPSIDPHGKMVANFLISILIYSFIAGLLCLVFIGFLLLMVLGLVAIVFPIIGAIKASNGELWKYPLMIEFLK